MSQDWDELGVAGVMWKGSVLPCHIIVGNVGQCRNVLRLFSEPEKFNAKVFLRPNIL